jgi:hypothetical protein
VRDPSLDTLLFLDGTTYVLDPDGRYRVKIEVKRVPATPEKPHGLDYALTLHGPGSGHPRDTRLVGFDNAHPTRARSGPSGAQRAAWDHKHRFRTVRPYDYADAASLLADFWKAVDQVLAERGVKP